MTKTYNALTFVQRSHIIDKYIKVAFALIGDDTYEMPRLTMAQMAEAATKAVGFKVTPQNVKGCIDNMGELGFKIVKPAVGPESNKARIEDLERRVAALEKELAAARRFRPTMRPKDVESINADPGLPFTVAKTGGE